MNLPAGFPTEATNIVIEAASPDDTGEHIFIEDELGKAELEPRTVSGQIAISNHLRGTRMQILLYREGFIRLREGSKKSVLKDHLCELDFIDPVFETRRHLSKRCLLGALGAAVFAAVAWQLLPVVGLAYAMPVTVAVLLAAAVVMLRIGLLRSYVEHRFVTATGRTVVLRLTGNLGCLRKLHRAAQSVAAAVRKSGVDTGQQDERLLRAEMRAHYRLLERGVISKEACARGTQLILSRFG